MSTTQIVYLIVDALRDYLLNVCQTQVDSADPTRADVVQIGRYRDEPVIKNIHLGVIGGDPDDINYKDGILTLEDMDNIGYRFPVGEIGGGRLWWRRGVIQVGCYFINQQYSQEVAAGYAYTVLGRIEAAVPQCYVGSLVDSFGEQAIMISCYGNTFTESGGPPGSYIWRGKVYWSCLTHRPQ